MRQLMRACAASVAAFGCLAPVFAAQSDSPSEQQRSLEELRNTIINLLESLVQRGVLTREQADALVKAAQEKAAADAAALAQQRKEQEKEEQNAVRVPYVPQIVKDQISKQVVEELGPSVREQVVQDINSQGTLRKALPEWMQRIAWTGDIRVRGEGDLLSSSNATNAYLDYNQVNSAGGIAKAGANAYLNTTESQYRPRVRARFGFDADLGEGWTAAVRLATGSTGEIIATTNQTLGAYGAGYTTTLDQGYLRWTGNSSSGRQIFSVTGGRFGNPWLGTDLIWYNDLTFEGFVSKYRLNFSADNLHRKDLFITLGAFPIESFSVLNPDPYGKQKWLLAGQLGVDFRTQNDSHFQLAGAYYDYLHSVGQLNTFQSTLENWTVPTFVQKGNTMFHISNTTDPTVNLWALAAQYRTVDVIGIADFRVQPGFSLMLSAEALRNVGYNTAEVSARVGTYTAARTRGYRGDLSFGAPAIDRFGAWRGSVGYRYLQRDAVLDAFNDEDFHLGGTDAKGYTLLFDFGFTRYVWLRAKYLAATAIDGLPLAIDVVQLDVNTQF
jgi:hypothetical protein